MPLVSIIVPTFNHREYLDQTLQSVLDQQTDLDIEIVVVNDASSDGTASSEGLARQIPGLVWLDHHINKGKLAALNTAAQVISGEYVVVLDSDDILEPNFLESCFRHLQRTGADFVYTSCTLIDQSNDVVGFGKSMEFCAKKIESYSFIPDLAFTRTEKFRLGVPFDESVRVLPKHYRWKLLCRLGLKGAYLEENLFRYRMHGENMSGIGTKILANLKEGRTDHHLLSGYWEANQTAVV